MKVLYFDCFSGISGDMAMGALIDLGIDHNVLKNELAKLELDGYTLEINKKSQRGIFGTDVKVVLEHSHHELDDTHDDHHNNHNHNHDDNHNHGHHHEHSHEHSHEHGHEHSHEHTHGHHHGDTVRNFKDIQDIIDKSSLNPKVKELSIKIFKEIAIAEAQVHNKAVDEVHFHEVGAVDSIVDIVGTAICLNLLGVDKVFSSPMHDGRGFIECQHGIIPVPVPAVMEMLKDSNIPLVTEDINTELITPTGMGIIKSISSGFGNMPAMAIDRIGYGMGKRETGRLNALRVVMGTLFQEDNHLEEIAVLETNIDDMSPEILGFTVEKLMQNGALDVFYSPIYMKKNRPAVMLTVLCDKEKEKALVDIILAETTSLGIRRNICERYCMDRKTVKVDTKYGEVRVKIAQMGGVKKISPEYEDCREIALKTGIPLREIFNMVYGEFKDAL